MLELCLFLILIVLFIALAIAWCIELKIDFVDAYLATVLVFTAIVCVQNYIDNHAP